MKYIHYGGSLIMTGDDIADAVLEYAAVLGANVRTDTVHVPTPDEHGELVYAAILIGPASEIVVDPAPDDELEPEDPKLVEQLRRAARSIGTTKPVLADGIDPLGIN